MLEKKFKKIVAKLKLGLVLSAEELYILNAFEKEISARLNTEADTSKLNANLFV